MSTSEKQGKTNIQHEEVSKKTENQGCNCAATNSKCVPPCCCGNKCTCSQNCSCQAKNSSNQATK